MSERPPLQVEVVAADRMVWEGKAVNVITRTTEGDIGILPGHEPLMAALVPHAAEIVTVDGRREIVALDGGFVSVAGNRVSLLSQSARLSAEVSAEEAHREHAKLQTRIDKGEATDAEIHRYHLATAQLKAIEKLH